MKDTECFKINDIDVDKIIVSDKRLCSKQHNPYKYYVSYDLDNKYIPLKIILIDAVRYYNDYKGNSKYDTKYSAKKINLRLDHDSLDKVYDIFEYIEKK